MKAKLLITALLLAASNFALAQGGLSIENVEQHMNASTWVSTNTDRAQIVVQGPIDKFEAADQAVNRDLVDTNKFKQAYNGQS